MSPSSTVQKKGLEKECLRLKEILSFKNTCMDNPEYRGLTTEKLIAALEENNSNLTAHVSLGSICICQKKKKIPIDWPQICLQNQEMICTSHPKSGASEYFFLRNKIINR